MTRTRERRWLNTGVKLRSAEGAAKPGIEGYAARFGAEYRVFGPKEKYVETIAKGAFRRTLEEMPDVLALYNHNTDCVLGRVSAGTLRLWEDDDGLAFDDDLPDTSYGRDAAISIGRGDIKGCSFGFSVEEYSTMQRADGVTVFTLLDVTLYEISPAVAFPAYEETQVSLRARGRYDLIRADPRHSLDLARRRLQLASL